MPIYMDVHIVPGVNAKAVAEAHSKDIELQSDHACKCMTYWIDEARESVFCLIEAPNMEAVVHMHNRAHGLIPHKIIEVNGGLVENFLGRLYDPSDADIIDGMPVFHDPAFRVVIITHTTDPVLLRHQLGREKANDLISKSNEYIRRNLSQFGGRQVEAESNGFILSFKSAISAVNFALSVQGEMPKDLADAIGFRMSINSGEPVAAGSNKLFGEAVQLAQNICTLQRSFRVAITSSVRALVDKGELQKENQLMSLAPPDENLLLKLFNVLEENWQNADFDVDDFCKAMVMSKSQLYRKCIQLTGFAPNVLIREYRLEKAKELMKKQHYNIAQITFDSGFTSPSYFTKCFKKKYGLLPMTYVEMLQ